jgi:hypothetical protein
MASKKTKTAAKKKPTEATESTETRVPKGDEYEEKLPCAIPIEEEHAAGKELALTIRRFSAWRDKRKAENIKAREEKTFFEGRIDELGEAIEQHSVTRRVPCRDFLVTKNGKSVIEVVRLDTQAVVMTREPTDEERQDGMGFGEPATKGKKPKKTKDGVSASDLAPSGPLRGPSEVGAPFGDDDQEKRGDIEDPDLE